MAMDWNTYKPTVLKQESGGDYNALYNFAQKPGRIFAGVQPTQMTINDLLNFANPSGPYGQYVKETRPDKQFGVATPLGAYGVVGSTLRDAVKGLGLTGDELFDQATQDKVAEWLYNKRGTSPWTASNKKPVGDIMAMQPNQIPARQPGLLSEFGLQKRDPNATGQTAQPFYQRNNFKDFVGNLAIGLNSMRISPDPNIAAVVQNSQKNRKETDTKNRTTEWLIAQGRPDLAEAVRGGMLGASDAFGIMSNKGDVKEVNGRLIRINPDGTTEDITPEGIAGALNKDQQSSLNTLRDDVRSEFATFDLVQQGNEKIQLFFQNPSGVSDYALAVSFAKILDPGSVAREGEVNAVRNAGAAIPGWGQQMVNMINGQGTLTPETRQIIAKLSSESYKLALGDAQRKLMKYKQLAEASGLPSDFIYMGADLGIPPVSFEPN